MSKRVSSKQLRPDEEDDDAPTEAGKWEEAPESVIAKRKIVKVRSKNTTDASANSASQPMTVKPASNAPVSAEKTPETQSTPTEILTEPEKPDNQASKDVPKTTCEIKTTETPNETTSSTTSSTTEVPKFEVKLAADFSFKPLQTQASAAKPVFQFNFQSPLATNGEKETSAAPQAPAPLNFSFNFATVPSPQPSFQWKLFDANTAPKSNSKGGDDAEEDDNTNGNEAEASGAYDEVGDSGTTKYEPILPEVPIVTGEEDDESLCKFKAKLLSLNENSWSERGVGIIHLYKHKQGTYRLVMRTLGTLRLILNSVVVSKTLCTLDKDNTKCIRITLTDTVSNAKEGVTAFAVRFQAALDASQMLEQINKAKEKLSVAEPSAEKKQA